MDYAFGGAGGTAYGTTLEISGSTFANNVAQGGNSSTVSGTDMIGAGGAEGGAIYAEVGVTTTVSNCTFSRNQAQGGNGNTGSGPVALVGEALGGAIVSGYGGVNATYGPDTLTVSNSTFIQNNAVGGNKNKGTASVSALVGVAQGQALRTMRGAWPASAAARSPRTRPLAAAATWPAVRDWSLPTLGQGAEYSIIWGIMTLPASVNSTPALSP